MSDADTIAARKRMMTRRGYLRWLEMIGAIKGDCDTKKRVQQGEGRGTLDFKPEIFCKVCNYFGRNKSGALVFDWEILPAVPSYKI
jgi:hypothetical protein